MQLQMHPYVKNVVIHVMSVVGMPVIAHHV